MPTLALPDFLQSLLHPFAQLVAAALAAAHTGLSTVGLDPAGGLTWVLSIALLVVGVRVVLLPLTVHGVRLARAGASARPELEALRRRYRGRTDVESLRAMREEQRRIQAEHGVPRTGCLPVLLQLPILFALYQVLSQVANGQPVGAMDLTLVASAGSASLLGLGLAERAGRWGDLLASPRQLLVIAVLALLSAGLSFVTQRWFVLPNLVLAGLPEPMADAQRLMPVLSAVGVLTAAAVVPAGLLVYWVVSNAWTLGQQAVVARWFPTPGSAAHQAWLTRRGTSPA